MRIVTALLVLGAALVGAFVLHGHRVGYRTHCVVAGPASGTTTATFCIRERRPGWVEPTALGIVLVGLAGAVALMTAGRSFRREDGPATA